MTSDSLPAAIVSASTASAPIGVRSSWLTLATKSRRMLSIRRASVTSRTNATAPLGDPSSRQRKRAQVQRLLRRAEQDELALRRLTERAWSRSSPIACAATASEWRAPLKRARGRVAHQHLAVISHDHHAVGHGLQSAAASRSRSTLQAVRVGQEIGDHRLDPVGRRSVRLAVAAARPALRPVARGVARSRAPRGAVRRRRPGSRAPVPSAEPARDVALGARIGRAR